MHIEMLKEYEEWKKEFHWLFSICSEEQCFLIFESAYLRGKNDYSK